MHLYFRKRLRNFANVCDVKKHQQHFFLFATSLNFTERKPIKNKPMKTREAKALKPSEMGLHSKVRYVLTPDGATRPEQELCIIRYAAYLFICLSLCAQLSLQMNWS